MENQPDNPRSESRPTGIGPGERLQAARIQQGLSIDDVAGRMHLSINILESIENNSFDEITAPIFVKGYLRAYARIVSLDEDELIQQYGEFYSHEDPPITTTSNMAPELSVADVRIKWTTYLVILGLAALLAAWWWNKKQGEAIPISLDSQPGEQQIVQSQAPGAGGMNDPRAQTGAPEPAPADNAAASVEPAPPAEPAAPEPVAPQSESPKPVAAESTVAEPAVPAPPEPPAAENAVAESAAPAPPEPDAAVPEGAAAPAPESVAEAPPGEIESSPSPAGEDAAAQEPARVRLGTPILVAPTGEDILSITVNADTWADIKDATDFQMVYHLLRADQSLELTGSAPFSVFLGNGHGVEIRFNDEPIDFSGRIRNDNTARLKIGG